MIQIDISQVKWWQWMWIAALTSVGGGLASYAARVTVVVFERWSS